MFRLIRRSLLTAAVLSVPAWAQITVPTNTFQPAPGTVIQFRTDALVDSAYFVSVSAGTGGPKQWDFSTRTYGAGIPIHVVSTTSTPGITTFPDANLVFLTITGVDSSWSVQKSVPTAFWRLGAVTHGTSGEIVVAYQDTTADWVFPIAYGNTWTSWRHWTQVAGAFHTDILDTTYYATDAWGTAKYGSKSVPCLRVMAHERFTYKTYDGSNVLVNTFSMDMYTANFIAAGFNSLASVTKAVQTGLTSYSGDASADFLDQQTDVNETGADNLPSGYSVDQNYPNPFNPQTDIRFSIPTKSDVKLTVYNIAGQAVKVLMSGQLRAGSYTVSWDGTDQADRHVASGVYLYRLQAGQYGATRKMVLLK
jgi:hypothetical protein